MFSRRLSWDQNANPWSILLAEKRRAGARVLDLTDSNPTRAGFDYPAPDILDALTDPRSLRYDPSPLGAPDARAAVAEYYGARGVFVDPAQILLTASTSEAYAYLFKLLADPGDEILTPRPSYPLFEYLAALESVAVRQYPLRYDGAWHVDFDALERSITPGTRAIVVVNPNNPTGSFLKEDELERLDLLAAEHDLAILSDEVFSDYGFEPPLVSTSDGRMTTLIGECRALTFSMSGLSKIAGLPQLKLGWIIVNGPGSPGAIDRLELIADTYLSVSTPVQAGVPRILASAGFVQDQIRARTESNLATLREALDGSPFHVLQVEGGWNAVVQAPRTRSEEDWALSLLRDHDVLVQPGFFFDFEAEAFLVVSLLTKPEIFAEGIERLLATWESPG